jgi:hypothetical protein
MKKMDIPEYFDNVRGTGVLATADSEGIVDAAVFARPHIMDEKTVAFIMPDRLTHHNLQSNDHATYLFMEEGPGYKGIRLFLKKTGEEKDTDLLHAIRRKKYAEPPSEDNSRFLVFFKVESSLPLVGGRKDA